jgi:Protein of unknown function (DUF3179)
VWETTVDGRELHFDLNGINNQNFIMRDRETGSWWQQVSGEALQGPLKGKKLKLVAYEEMSFDLWKQEQPGTRVLLPDPEIAKKEAYARSNWEERIAKLPVAGPLQESDPLKPRDLIVGLEINGKTKAYPFASLKKNRAIIDSLENVPLLVLLGEDNLTVRAFETTVAKNILDLYVKSNPPAPLFLDVNTGSEWNFEGKAVSGPLAGKQLHKIPVLKDYWFDWKNYHPDTAVYSR